MQVPQSNHPHHILPTHSDNLNQEFEQILDLLDNTNYDEAKDLLASMHPADFADFLDNSNHKTHKKVIVLLGSNFKSDTLVWISFAVKNSLETIITPNKMANLIDELDIEDAIEVVEDFSDEYRKQILSHLDKEKQRHIIEGFTYPEHTAGRVMEKQFISFPENWTVERALGYTRKHSMEHDFHAAIIVDSKHKPVGNVLLCTLLQSKDDAKLKDLMNEDFKIADTNTDLDQLSYIFKQYALTIVPVTNKIGKLVGTVSISNMIYIVAEQVEEDFMRLGGVDARNTSGSLFHAAKSRFPWLFINLLTAFITSLVIDQFSDTIAKFVTLAAVMPIVASMGGNAGTQAMTVTVRALAAKDIAHANDMRIIMRELMLCGFNGFILACIGGSIMMGLFSDISLSVVFFIAVIINFLVAGLFGAMIPIVLERMDIDPATASGVFLTTLTDSFGFFVFLTLAYVFLV